MKKSFLLKLLFVFVMAGMSVRAQAQKKHADLQMSVYTPHQNEVISYGDTAFIRILVKNLGPDTLKIGQDSIFFSNNIFPNIASINWANLAPMDTAVFLTLKDWNNGSLLNDTESVCLYFIPGSSTFVDTNKSNDTACVTFILKGRVTTGIEKPQNNNCQLTLYPNPARQNVHLNFSLTKPERAAITVSDVLGREIQRKTYSLSGGVHQEILDVSNLHSGVYFVKLQAGSQIAIEKMSVR